MIYYKCNKGKKPYYKTQNWKEEMKMEKKRLVDDVLKIDPDFMKYSSMDDRDEWDTLNDYLIYHLEHELDIYYEWKEEGFKKPFSWVQKENINKVKRVIDNYYNGKYIDE